MARPRPKPVEQDSRGILDPWLLRQQVRLTRYPASPALSGLIDRFWAVEWDLPDHTVHSQQVLTHPGANLTVGHTDARSTADPPGHIEARLNGVARELTTRVLSGRGWTVAAMTTPGGLGAFLTQSASALTDRAVPLGQALGVDEELLVERIAMAEDPSARVAVLAAALEDVLAAADPGRVARARQVAELGQLAETDRSLRQLPDLCARAGLGPRTLQRMFLQHAGVPPTWVLRRYRLLEAAERVRDGQRVSWATVAADLGYADQAHLTRDFRSAIGQTPAAYAEAQPADETLAGRVVGVPCESGPMTKEVQITFDCADPAGLAAFWAAVLGYQVQPPPDGFDSWNAALEAFGVPREQWNSRSAILPVEGPHPRIFFQRVPGAKTVKNRVHLDVRAAPGLEGDDRMSALETEANRLEVLGATRAYRVEPDNATMESGFITMRDPEGNEFCLD